MGWKEYIKEDSLVGWVMDNQAKEEKAKRLNITHTSHNMWKSKDGKKVYKWDESKKNFIDDTHNLKNIDKF